MFVSRVCPVCVHVLCVCMFCVCVLENVYFSAVAAMTGTPAKCPVSEEECDTKFVYNFN